MSQLKEVVDLLNVPGFKFTSTRKSQTNRVGQLNRMVLVDLINQGIPSVCLDHVLNTVHWQKSTVANWLDVSEKTIRRYEKEKKSFPRHVGARVVDFAKVIVAGKEVFESYELFNEWMETPCVAFGRKKPLELLSNSEGVQMILDELERVEWGVYG